MLNSAKGCHLKERVAAKEWHKLSKACQSWTLNNVPHKYSWLSAFYFGYQSWKGYNMAVQWCDGRVDNQMEFYGYGLMPENYD